MVQNTLIWYSEFTTVKTELLLTLNLILEGFCMFASLCMTHGLSSPVDLLSTSCLPSFLPSFFTTASPWRSEDCHSLSPSLIFSFFHKHTFSSLLSLSLSHFLQHSPAPTQEALLKSVFSSCTVSICCVCVWCVCVVCVCMCAGGL